MINLKDKIIAIISQINLKDGKNLSNIISDIVIKTNNIGFSIDISDYGLEEGEKVKNHAMAKLADLKEIKKITIVLTGNLNKNNNQKPKYFIENVKQIILISSGKGGVGKSTISSIIAENLSLQGHNVGIVDADIYGSSIPQIFGINKMPEIIDKKMIPIISRNIQIISMGFLTKEGQAIAWRGPMASKAIYQLLSLTKWDNIDYLIIDMPPGTGDIHLSILENYNIDGVIMVTIPQEMSLIDVERAINLYQKFNIKILGIIENMSYFKDDNGQIIKIFEGNAGEILSSKYNLNLIQKLPILPELAKACDKGQVLSDIVKISLKKII